MTLGNGLHSGYEDVRSQGFDCRSMQYIPQGEADCGWLRVADNLITLI